jgi:hypothetical protein
MKFKKWLAKNRKWVDLAIIVYLGGFTGELTIATVLFGLYVVDPHWK